MGSGITNFILLFEEKMILRQIIQKGQSIAFYKILNICKRKLNWMRKKKNLHEFCKAIRLNW